MLTTSHKNAQKVRSTCTAFQVHCLPTFFVMHRQQIEKTHTRVPATSCPRSHYHGTHTEGNRCSVEYVVYCFVNSPDVVPNLPFAFRANLRCRMSAYVVHLRLLSVYHFRGLLAALTAYPFLSFSCACLTTCHVQRRPDQGSRAPQGSAVTVQPSSARHNGASVRQPHALCAVDIGSHMILGVLVAFCCCVLLWLLTCRCD